MKLSDIEDVESAVKEYQHERYALELVKLALAGSSEERLSLVIREKNILDAAFNEPINLERHKFTMSKILAIAMDYLEKTLADSKAELERLGVQVDC